MGFTYDGPNISFVHSPWTRQDWYGSTMATIAGNRRALLLSLVGVQVEVVMVLLVGNSTPGCGVDFKILLVIRVADLMWDHK